MTSSALKQFAFVVEGKHIGAGAEIVSLPRPLAPAEPARYMLLDGCKRVLEVQQINEGARLPRSLFINDSVQRSGVLYMATVVDPLFLLVATLPFAASRSMFTTPDQLLSFNEEINDRFPALSKIDFAADQLALVCDVNADGPFYRLSEDKIIAWIAKKVQRLSDAVATHNINTSHNSHSATFVSVDESDKSEEALKEERLVFAFGIIGEYVSRTLCEKAAKTLNVTLPSEVIPSKGKGTKRSADSAQLSELPVDDYTDKYTKKAEKKAKLSVTQKALEKVDKKGMKSMMSFFQKKPKKETPKAQEKESTAGDTALRRSPRKKLQ